MELIIPLFIVLAIVLMIFSAAQARKRRQALQQWARQRGFGYTQEKNRQFDEVYSAFSCLTRGSNRYAYNIMTGVHAGRQVAAFDYHYETQSTNSKGESETDSHYFSAVILRAELPLKALTIRRENFFDKIAGVFGWDDIDFESAEFSRRFHVSASDRRWAYDVIHPRTMQRLLDEPRFNVQMDASHVIAWHSGTFDPHEFDAALRLIVDLLDALPSYVRGDQP